MNTPPTTLLEEIDLPCAYPGFIELLDRIPLRATPDFAVGHIVGLVSRTTPTRPYQWFQALVGELDALEMNEVRPVLNILLVVSDAVVICLREGGTVAPELNEATRCQQWSSGYLAAFDGEVNPSPHVRAQLGPVIAWQSDLDDRELEPVIAQLRTIDLSDFARAMYTRLERERVSVLRDSTDSGVTRRRAPKIGRNQRCPCGSGKKYKKCCLLDEQQRV